MAKDKQSGLATMSRNEPTKKVTAAPIVVAPKATPAPVRTYVPESTRVVAAPALPFGRQNYVFMLVGIGIILAGFFIMSLDKEEFGFGFLGLTLGPIVVMGGFVLEFFAILARPKV